MRLPLFFLPSNDTTTTYYLDGAKILGEDRNGGMRKLRYFYDRDGICGMRYALRKVILISTDFKG